MNRFLGRWAGCAAVALWLAAGSAGAQAPVLQVSDAWVRPAVAGKNSTSAVYFTVSNTGPLQDTLLGVSTPAADAAELHETIHAPDGMMRMQPRPQGIAIPPRSEVRLKPGGYHLMLIGLKQPIQPGERIALTLRFAKARAVTVNAAALERAGGGYGAMTPSSAPAHATPGRAAKK